MVFLTTESASKAEINILSARDTTRPGPQARASWVMMQWYIKGSIACCVHLGLRTNRPPLTDDKFTLVCKLTSCLTVKPRRMAANCSEFGPWFPSRFPVIFSWHSNVLVSGCPSLLIPT